MNPYDMVVSDWDMTLAPSPGVELGERTKAVLEQLRERRVRVVLASGRPTPGLINLVANNRVPLSNVHIIGFNGGTISHATTPADFLFASPLHPDVVHAAQHFADEQDLEFLIPTSAAIYTSQPLGRYTKVEAESAKVDPAPLSAWEPAVTPALKIEMITHGLADEEVQLQQLRDAIAATGHGAELVFAGPGQLEINAPGANKGAALAVLADHLGVALDRIVAFGDNHNDVSLLQAAGAGYAVGNAVPELRAAATGTIGSVRDEAVAAKLTEIFGLE